MVNSIGLEVVDRLLLLLRADDVTEGEKLKILDRVNQLLK